jgi:ribose 5-phosphate isomerase B
MTVNVDIIILTKKNIMIKINIGSDHAGYVLKNQIIVFLKEQGYEVEDSGIYEEKSITDYSVAEKVALSVVKDRDRRGILICGTGIGMSIAANKIPSIRAALCHNEFTAKSTRLHNDSNILVMGARVVDSKTAKNIVSEWIVTEFEGGRHIQRNNSIQKIEKKYLIQSSIRKDKDIHK